MQIAEQNSGDWAGGLCGWGTSTDEDCGMCVLALFCPAVMYGINYHTAMLGTTAHQHDGLDCIMPCIAHTLADVCLSSIVLSFCCSCNGATFTLPFACCLRYTHRRAAIALHFESSADQHGESRCATLGKEFLCWGCSMAQVNRELRHPSGKSARVTGFTPIGTLWATNNSMAAAPLYEPLKTVPVVAPTAAR